MISPNFYKHQHTQVLNLKPEDMRVLPKLHPQEHHSSTPNNTSITHHPDDISQHLQE